MVYLIVIFCSPAYFAKRRMWGAFVLNLCFYGFAWLLLISIVGAIFSLMPWAPGVAHAMFYGRKEMVEEAAEIFADKMTEKLTRKKAETVQ